jgi:hypothetical protein
MHSMYEHSRFTAVLGFIALLAITGCATNGAAPTATSATQPAGILSQVPHYMPTRGHAVRNTSGISYGGGPVEVTPTVFLIFWGYAKYGDPRHVKPLLKDYIANMGGSGHNNIYTEYYEISNSKMLYITNPKSQLGGVWDDNASVPRQPTQTQIEAEALKGVAHFGYNANASYVVATPHGRSVDGFGTSFCAYHSATSSKGRLVSYTNLPYIPDARAACGANYITPPSDETGADEGVTIVEGSEQGDSATDPDPPTGWQFDGAEISIVCAWQNIANDTFGSHSYTMQSMYSNASRSCVQSY